MASDRDTQIGGGLRQFPLTQWTEILAARTTDPAHRRALLEPLLERYWKPVYAFLRQRGKDNEDAKDLTQGFFEEIVLRRELFQKADPARGRFRTYLLTALRRYVVDMHRRDQAGHRRPKGARLVAMDAFEDPPPVPARGAGPELAFSYSWACQLLEDVLAAVERGCRRARLAVHWEVFRRTLVEPELRGTARPALAELCREMGIADERAASNMSVTVKRRFRAVLRARVREMVASDDQVDEEIREMMGILSRAAEARRP